MTSPGNDYISWASVTDALTYTVVMTPSIGPVQTATTVAPVTSTLMGDLYTTPVTVTYAVSATNSANVPGPSTLAVVTPTVVDNTASPFTYRNMSPPGPGHWAPCANANAGTSGCSSNPGVTSALYSNSYNGSLGWSKAISDTVDVQAVGLSAPAHVQLYGAVTPKGGQAWVWVDSTPHPTAVPTAATLIDWYSSTAVARKLITTQPIGPNQYLHITLNGTHAGCTAAGGGSGCSSYVGIDAINVQP